jgi:hypothetical protein
LFPFLIWLLSICRCSLRSDCQDAAKDPLYWISYKSGRCTTITSVTPNQLQRTTARTVKTHFLFLLFIFIDELLLYSYWHRYFLLLTVDWFFFTRSSRWWSTICRLYRANFSAPFQHSAKRCWQMPLGRQTEWAVPHLVRITFRPTLLDNVRELFPSFFILFPLFSLSRSPLFFSR